MEQNKKIALLPRRNNLFSFNFQFYFYVTSKLHKITSLELFEPFNDTIHRHIFYDLFTVIHTRSRSTVPIFS